MNFFKWKLGLVALTFSFAAPLFANQASIKTKQIEKEKKAFVKEMANKYHFSYDSINHLIQSQQPNEKILTAMTRPFEKANWNRYRDFFVTPERINYGVTYFKKYHHALLNMQKKYGVPASIITAIIGVETEYGRHLGTYSVLNTLYTLGFYYPAREQFFRKELAEYLRLTRDNHLNATKLKGSYAGALGIPQFMPSSYRYYGKSYTKGSNVDLFNNTDAIASVANYFHKMGWRPNQPIATQLQTTQLGSKIKHAKKITLQMDKGTENWAIYRNFNVIMSYNHNVVYAMAVYQLSKAIEKQYAKLNDN